MTEIRTLRDCIETLEAAMHRGPVRGPLNPDVKLNVDDVRSIIAVLEAAEKGA